MVDAAAEGASTDPAVAAAAAAATAAVNAAAESFDTTALNAMITTVSQITGTVSTSLMDQLIGCQKGTACYNGKRNSFLETKLSAAKTAYASAPLDLSRAEKNYYEFNGGENGGEDIYNKMIIDRFATTAEQFKQNSIEKQQDFMADLAQILKQYEGEVLFAAREEDLLGVRLKEYADLLKKINKYQAIVQTSQRKVAYEYKDMDSLYLYRRIMLFLYYSVIVIYIIFGNFIPDKLYLKKTVWLMIIIAAIVPIIFNICIKWLFIFADAFSYWYSDVVPKDVYHDL